MEARYLICNREAQAASAPRSVRHAIEALANRLPLIRRNSRAIVIDPDIGPALGDAASHRYVPPRGDITKRVVDQVREHLANQPCDTLDTHGLDLGSKIDAFGERPIEVLSHHILDELAAVECGELIGQMYRRVRAGERE
jgi:hypothetical protein